VRRLRTLTALVFACAFAAAFLASSGVQFCLFLFAVPAGFVSMRPRWPAIVLWIMWTMTWGTLAITLALGGGSGRMPSASYALLAAACLLLYSAIPLVRRTHAAPSVPRQRTGGTTRPRDRIPQARIHKRAR
jgi:hypothetical protein